MIKETTFKPSVAPDYNIILESVNDCILAIDQNYNIIYHNNSFKERFELFVGEKLNTENNLASYSGLDRFTDFLDSWNEWFERCFSKEKFKEKVHYKISGKTLHFTLHFTPIIREDEVKYIQITMVDETIIHQYEELVKQNVKNQIPDRFPDTKKELTVEEERDEALRLLIENVERLQIVFDGTEDGFWDWDIEKDEIFYNRRYYEIFGFRNGELKSDIATWQNRIHPDDVNRVIEELYAHLDGKTENFRSEYRFLTKNNGYKWIFDKGKVAIRDENNNPLRFAGTISDIGERKKAEEILKESEARFVNIADNLPVMLWMTDQKITLKYINPKAKRFVGNQNTNKDIKEIVHEDDLEFFKKGLFNVYKKKEKFEGEIRLKNHNNEYRWILANIVPRKLSNDNFIGLLGIGIDITERKEAENKLLESEAEFNEITSVVAEGIFLIDNDFNLKFANPEFSKLLGYKFDNCEGKNILENIYNFGEKSKKECPICKVLETGDTIRISHDYFRTKNDIDIPVSFVSSPIKRNGEIVGCVTAFHDISDIVESEEEIKRFVEELQFNKELVEETAIEASRLNEKLWDSEAKLKELNASKDKFFSIISHDLRSPLTSILGFAEVLVEDLDILNKEEIKEFTNSIYKSSKNVQNLLENLLQWSRVQTGRIEFNPINFELNTLINDVIALYQVNAARKKIALSNNVEKIFRINADKFMLDTVLRNLVSNSIKFTRQGGEIKIDVDNFDDNSIVVTVSDNGVGIKDEIIEKLFKIDSHVTTKGTDKEKGTGLGLILCKEFIEKNNGKIWAESKINEGSDFKFTLPYKTERTD